MKYLILFVSFMFIPLNFLSADDSQFVLTDFQSLGIALQGQSQTKVGGGEFETVRKDRAKSLKSYSMEGCKNRIKELILTTRKTDDSFGYESNGVYLLGGSFGRYFCIEYDIAQKYFVDENFWTVGEKFYSDFSDKIPNEIEPEKVLTYTIFPLLKDQKEAKKVTENLDNELAKSIKQVHKTSYDCYAENLSRLEKTICTDSELAELDVQLNKAYRSALKKHPKDTDKIKDSQREWLNFLNKYPNSFSIRSIGSAYNSRLIYLNCLLDKDFKKC